MGVAPCQAYAVDQTQGLHMPGKYSFNWAPEKKGWISMNQDGETTRLLRNIEIRAGLGTC